MTGGVRADRVGAKLSRVHVLVRSRVKPQAKDARRTRALPPAKAGAWQREVPAAKAARPLARETSAGGRIASHRVEAPGVARSPESRAKARPMRRPPVTEHRGESLDTRSRRSPGESLCGRGPTWASGARERTLGRASAGLGHRGSVDPVVVLAGCLGCRSRRAALGPGRLTRRKAARRKARVTNGV